MKTFAAVFANVHSGSFAEDEISAGHYNAWNYLQCRWESAAFLCGNTQGCACGSGRCHQPAYMEQYVSGGAITGAVICSYNGTTYSWLMH
jgi:hypothetical protein